MKDRLNEGDRLSRVFRSWVRAQARRNPARFGARPELNDLRLLLVVLPFAVAGYLGQPDNSLVSWVRTLPPGGAALGLAALWSWNGWLSDR